jgi:hypothetical protein
VGNQGCAACGTYLQPAGGYWSWAAVNASAAADSVDAQCAWACAAGYRLRPAGAMTTAVCVPCSPRPAANPCAVGEYWNAACSSAADAGCVPCAGMLGTGTWLRAAQWYSSACPYACQRGFYDFNATSGGDFLKPNCTACPPNTPGCGLGSAFGVWIP